jgi:hypothetical protein
MESPELGYKISGNEINMLECRVGEIEKEFLHGSRLSERMFECKLT